MVTMDTMFRILIRDVNERGQGVGTVLNDGHDDSVNASDLDRGKVCFVNGALPGEVVTARLIEDKRNYRVLDLVDVEVPSPDRVLHDCSYYPECGVANCVISTTTRNFDSKKTESVIFSQGLKAPIPRSSCRS